MPSLPKRPCARCGALLAAGAVCACSRAKDRERGTTAERGYGSDWEKVRALKLATQAFCELRITCQGAIATEVDHFIAITENPDLRLTWSNLRSSCKACNVAKRNRNQPKNQHGMVRFRS